MIGPSLDNQYAAKALSEEIADTFAPSHNRFQAHAKSRALDRELEAVGRGICPFLPAFGLLMRRMKVALISIAPSLLDAYSSSLACGNLSGSENPAPRRICPAADADADFAFAHAAAALC